MIVVLSHLVGGRYFAHMGFYAVRTFFVLSGFVMTSALNEVYGHDGFRFWSNRLLRLLPPYYVVCVVTAVAIRLYPDHAAAFLPRWGSAMTSAEFAQNLALAPLAFEALHFRLVPPAWSIAVEMMMYFMLYIGVARSLPGALLGFTVGVAFHCAWLSSGASFDDRYFTPGSALLSFALGATLYFFRKNDRKQASVAFGAFVLVVWFANLLAEGTVFPDGYALYAGFYVNVLLAALVIVFLSDFNPGPLLRRLDVALGNLSYPVFLCQWLGGFIVYLMWSQGQPRSWELALAALPIIILLSIALAWAHHLLVEPLRSRIRSARGFWRSGSPERQLART